MPYKYNTKCLSTNDNIAASGDDGPSPQVSHKTITTMKLASLCSARSCRSNRVSFWASGYHYNHRKI